MKLIEKGSELVIELSEKPFVIGRSPEADMVISDHKVSRFHCGIQLIDGHYELKDLKSRNGTFLNTDRIKDSKPLHDGDQFRMGETIFEVSEPTEQEQK